MKPFLIAVAAAVITVAAADAQYKTPEQTQTGPGTIKIDAPGLKQAGTVEDELSKAKRIARKAMKWSSRTRPSTSTSAQTPMTRNTSRAVSAPSVINARFKDLPPGKFLITCRLRGGTHKRPCGAGPQLSRNQDAAALLGGWNGWKAAGLPVVSSKGTAAKN